MKTSVRSIRFTMGIVLFLAIILLLAILSAFYINGLSKKTSAIFKENHYSVVFARNMSENMTLINQEIVNSLLTKRNINTSNLNKNFILFAKSLNLEKNNITEVGENALVSNIEINFKNYRDSVSNFIKYSGSVAKVVCLEEKFNGLYQQLTLLSQINEKAIEDKTNDAKISARNASIKMSLIGSVCFLIAYGFSFSFTSYFNERFYQLYNGIKEMVSTNYNQRLYFKGKDEFSEISLIFNEMAEKISNSNQEKALTLQVGSGIDQKPYNLQELKEVLIHMKMVEDQANELISKLENKKQ